MLLKSKRPIVYFPFTEKKLWNLYGHYLRWYHELKNDPVHKKVMKGYDYVALWKRMKWNTVEAATSKWKYLLNSLFDLDDFPKDTSNDEEDFPYEAGKRKHYQTF